MARGTDFGGTHSHRDLNLIQQKVDVQPATPKLNLVDVPGADGSKDLSAQPSGRVVYEDREITWTFALYPGENWDAKHRQVSNALNGRYCRITLDTDPGYYYLGRLVVRKYKLDGLLRQITVGATCQPWIWKQDPTVVTTSLTAGAAYKTLTLRNGRKPVVPEIKVTTKTTILFKGNTYSVAAGTQKILDIELQEGDNQLQAKAAAAGTVTITYQEGSL